MNPERIVHRDEIIKLQTTKTEQELVAVVRTVNIKLKAAVSLPVTFAENEFGSNEWVRRDVENRLRDAGWKVNAIKDEPSGPCSYQVQ